MDYVKRVGLVSAVVNTGRSNPTLSPADLVIRGGLAGAILAAARARALMQVPAE